MDEITLDDKTYVSSKRAAQITGYAKDYVGQLCREGRVEARLVGRNWYVLESSIREHRFGKEEGVSIAPAAVIQESEKAPLSTWETPSYMHEAFSALPKLTVPATEAEITVIAPEVHAEVTKNVVSEMQDTWKDWFKKEGTQNLIEEDLLEAPERTESDFSYQPTESVTESVPLTRVSEPVQRTKIAEDIDEEEVVPLHRSYAPAIQVELPSTQRPPQRPVSPSESFSYAQQRFVPTQQRRSIVVDKKKPSVVLSAVLLCITGLAIVVTLIGTGKLDTFLNTSKVNYYPVQYLGGESSFTKANK